MRGRFEDLEEARAYALAGHAILTASSRSTGDRFTFRVRLAPDEGRDARPWFVDVLTGPDNDGDYRYLGMLWPRDGGARYVHGRTSGVAADAPSAVAARWVLECLAWGRPDLLEQVDLWHEGACGRCGRRLTDPESVARGLGPVCAARLG